LGARSTINLTAHSKVSGAYVFRTLFRDAREEDFHRCQGNAMSARVSENASRKSRIYEYIR
jgi:hypothetical protein